MDIALFKTSWAGLMGQMLALDPVTGLPYDDYSDLAGTKVRANAEAPMSLADTDLPTWIFFTGPATYPLPPDQSIDRLARETRDMVARLYVGFSQAGIDGEAERKVQPYIDAARDMIQKHIQLWDGNPAHRVPGIKRAYLTKDSGVSTFRYSGNQIYLGVEFTVRVDADNEVDYDPRQ